MNSLVVVLAAILATSAGAPSGWGWGRPTEEAPEALWAAGARAAEELAVFKAREAADAARSEAAADEAAFKAKSGEALARARAADEDALRRGKSAEELASARAAEEGALAKAREAADAARAEAASDEAAFKAKSEALAAKAEAADAEAKRGAEALAARDRLASRRAAEAAALWNAQNAALQSSGPFGGALPAGWWPAHQAGAIVNPWFGPLAFPSVLPTVYLPHQHPVEVKTAARHHKGWQ